MPQHNKPYLLVGDGFAGLCMALQLLKHQKPFVLFAQSHEAASRKAAGVVNPVILKHFSMIHQHEWLMPTFAQNMQEISGFLGQNLFDDHPVSRIFANEYEQKSWIKKSRNHQLKYYLNPEIHQAEIVENPYGMAQIYKTGRLKVDLFFELMSQEIIKNNKIIHQKFDYQALDLQAQSYQGKAFEKVIFCEGWGLRHNPYFKHVPLDVNKGHCLKLNLSKPLPQNLIYKNKYFLFEETPSAYYYGGTNDNGNAHPEADLEQKEELEKYLQNLYPHDYQITQLAHGYRPMPTDRRVIVGQHPEHSALYIFNGVGARGILNAVCYAPVLYDFMENGQALHPEIDVNRYPLLRG